MHQVSFTWEPLSEGLLVRLRVRAHILRYRDKIAKVGLKYHICTNFMIFCVNFIDKPQKFMEANSRGGLIRGWEVNRRSGVLSHVEF